jgi:hypothetical protein
MCDTITTMNNTKEQYVYIMSNPSFDDDVFKIGWTREHPIIRANDLYTSGLPTPFVVEYVIITTEGVKLEKQLHTHLKQYRMENNREFFKISKDNLIEILTTELSLQVTSITELDVPTNKRTNGSANKISEMYEMLKKDWNEFSSPLRKDKTELVVREINNQKIVNIKTNIYNKNALKAMAFDDGTEERQIRNAFYFIERDIEQYKQHVDNILHNYKEIKDRIGDKRLRECNKELKRWILDTHNDLHELKNKYIWDV